MFIRWILSSRQSRKQMRTRYFLALYSKDANQARQKPGRLSFGIIILLFRALNDINRNRGYSPVVNLSSGNVTVFISQKNKQRCPHFLKIKKSDTAL